MDRVVASEVCVPASLTFSMRRGLIHEHIACSLLCTMQPREKSHKKQLRYSYILCIIMTYGTQKARQGVHDCKVEIHLAYVLLRQPLKQYVLYVYILHGLLHIAGQTLFSIHNGTIEWLFCFRLRDSNRCIDYIVIIP